MKRYFLLTLLALLFVQCAPKKLEAGQPGAGTMLGGDTLRIANDKIEYEVLIIDPGFSSWFNRNAKPRSYFTQSYLEARNLPWVAEWNIRTNQPLRYGDLYQQRIDYDGGTDYGFEVNYMLYYYLTYFQLENKVRLGGLPPRI